GDDLAACTPQVHVPRGRSGQRKDLQDTRVLRHLGEHTAEERGVVVTGEATPAGHDGDILLALRAVGDDPAVVALAIVVLPQLLAGTGVEGSQPAARVGDEHQVTAGGEQAGERRLRVLDLPR